MPSCLRTLPIINMHFKNLHVFTLINRAPYAPCLVLLQILSSCYKYQYNLCAEKFNIVETNMNTCRCKFLVLDWKHPFWVNSAQKIKIVSLHWNLVLRPIWICRIQWWYGHFFCFQKKLAFLGKFVQKVKIVSLHWNLVPRPNLVFVLIWICTIQWWCWLFSVFDQKYPFRANLVQKTKIVILSWSLVRRLIGLYRIQWWCPLLQFLMGNIFFG